MSSVYLIGNKDYFKKKFKKKKKIKIIETFLNKNNISLLNDLNYLLFIVRWVKKIRPHSIISFTIKPNLIALIISKIFSIPAIITISGLGTLFLRYKFIFICYLNLLKILINKKVVIFFHNKDDYFLFKNQKILNSTLYSKVIFGSGIDFKKFKYSKKNFNNNNFVFIGRLIKEKGVEELFDIIPYIKSISPNVNFKIIGQIDKNNPRSIDPKKLKSLINNKYIEYLNFETNLVKEYKKATCLILPSYREGLSKTLMEAMTSGVPIITTNVPGCADLVKNSGAGLLVKLKDRKSLKNQILKFIDFSISKKKVMSINAHTYAKKKFNERIIIKEYLNAIKKI